MASDLVLYIRSSDDVASSGVTCEAGRSWGDTIDILATDDPIQLLKQHSAAYGSLRKKFHFDVEMTSKSPVKSIEMTVTRWSTRITITGLNRKVTGGEKRELVRVLRRRTAKRLGAILGMLMTGLLAVATIAGLLLAVHFKP